MTKRDAIEHWWFGLSQPDRGRALRLTAADFLPQTLALDVMMCGCTVIAEGEIEDLDGGSVTGYGQPAELVVFLQEIRAAE